MKYILIISFIFVLVSNLFCQDPQKVLLIEELEKYDQAEIWFVDPGREKLTEIAKTISIDNVTDTKVYGVLSGNDLEKFLSFNIPFKLVQRNLTKSVLSASSVVEAMNWDIYPTYPQYDTIMHKLATDFPGLCRVDTIGESIEGRLILALKISDNVDIDEDEPEVFYSSSIHGDELAGYVLLLHLADHLLNSYSGGGLEQKLVDSLEIWINPLANPDGTFHGGDTISNPTRYNSASEDLNRRYPDPTISPFTIPVENVCMIDFIKERSFIMSANFHSGAEVLNFPWDNAWGEGRIHADSIWFNYICRRYADTVHNWSDPLYLNDLNNGVTRGDAWYQITGGRQDWVTYETQGREVTIEIDNVKQTDASQLLMLWDYNWRSLLMYLENAIYGIHGTVLDEDTRLPVRAKIFVAGHDSDSSHVYSDSLNGKFFRLLAQGNYDLVISADGYNTEYVNDVLVNNGIQTRLNVTLTKTPTSINDSLKEELFIWPVPSSDYIEVQMPDWLQDEIEYKIISMDGRIIKSGIVLRINTESIQIDIANLQSGLFISTFISRVTGESITGRFIKR